MRMVKFLSFIFEYERKVYFLLFTLFLIGFGFGCYHGLGNNTYVDSIFNSDTAWISVFLKDSICLFITFILGYTVIGFPLLCSNVVFYGIYCGIFLSKFSAVYGIKGALCSGVVLLPYYFVVITTLLLLTFSSLRMSVALFNVFKNGTRFISPKVYSLPHIVKFIVFLILIFIISLIYSFVLQPFIDKIL